MGLTAAEFRLLSETREDARQTRAELANLAVAFAEHCAAEEARAGVVAHRTAARAPWVAAIASVLAAAAALWTVVVR